MEDFITKYMPIILSTLAGIFGYFGIRISREAKKKIEAETEKEKASASEILANSAVALVEPYQKMVQQLIDKFNECQESLEGLKCEIDAIKENNDRVSVENMRLIRENTELKQKVERLERAVEELIKQIKELGEEPKFGNRINDSLRKGEK